AVTAASDAKKAAGAVAFAQRKVGLAGQRAANGPSGTKLGIQIPAGEILFFPTLPARVDDVKLKVGDETTGPVMTVTSANLVVESGLSMASDGTTRVQVQSPRAPARFVTVEPGLSAKGLVAVTPVGGDLGPGDLVVVGDNNAGSPSANGGKGKQTKGAGSAKKKP